MRRTSKKRRPPTKSGIPLMPPPVGRGAPALSPLPLLPHLRMHPLPKGAYQCGVIQPGTLFDKPQYICS